MNDLMGFTVFRNIDQKSNIYRLSINCRLIRLSLSAVKYLGTGYVVVFLDERKARVMVKAADAETPNCYKLAVAGGRSNERNGIIGKHLLDACTKVMGIGSHWGYAPEGSEGMIIFERSK